MGVIIEEDDFDTFDMLKELEIARANLYDKQQSNKQNEQSDIIEISEDEGETLLIEWYREGSSESEDFQLSISEKKNANKGRKKKVKISPRGKKQDQEDLGLQFLIQRVLRYP